MTLYTVWQFRSPSNPEIVTVVRVSEPNDLQVQHEYQTVLWRGYAASKKEAATHA